MKKAFIDTSALASILFKEQNSYTVQNIFSEFDKIYASDLLESEIRSAASRENTDQSEVDSLISSLSFFQPERSLTQELKSVLSIAPRLKGADLWHVACALYLAGDPPFLPFITLDRVQAEAASHLGFKILPGGWAAVHGTHESPTAYKTSKPRSKKKSKRR